VYKREVRLFRAISKESMANFEHKYTQFLETMAIYLRCYLLPILYLPPMAGAPPSLSGIAWDEHSHVYTWILHNYIRMHNWIIPFDD